jgi:hypothetical protein
VTGRRVVAGAVLAALNLVISWLVAVSWLITPGGSWDQDVIAGLTAAALSGAVLAVPTAFLTIVPVGLRWLRAWWLVVPVVLFALAVARVVHLSRVYPDLPDNSG